MSYTFNIFGGGTDTSDATATANDILSGKTAYINDEKIEGNIASKEATTYNTSSSDQTIFSGQYLNGNQTIKAVSTTNINAENIKYNVIVKVGDANDDDRIKNITGTFTKSDTVSSGQIAAAAGQMLSGYSAWVDGIEVKGNIATKIASNISTSGKTVTVPAGYYASQATKDVATGSATTPATTVTVNPSISIDSAGKITATASATKSITPTVIAGYVSSGTAGTITVSGSSTQQMTTKAATTYNTSTSDRTIESGTYLTGAQTIKAVTTSNISAGNIKTGVVVKVGDANSATRIKNVTGTFTAANTVSSGQTAAEANKILNGYSAWVDGSEVKGNISSKAAATYNTSTSDQSIASGQYLSGAQTIKAVTTSNISAGNIKVGVNVKVGDANSAGRIKNITGTFDGFITSRAVIHVIAPSGSTVVFKKGSTTMKTVSSSDALPNNNDSTMRDYYCSVASGDYTSWTMTATSGSKSSSKTITISAAKQYDVLLIFKTYIVKGGYVQSPFTLKLDYGRTAITTHTENYNAQEYLRTLIGYNGIACGFCTEQTVNVNNYSSLKIDVAFTYNQTNSEGYTGGIGLASSKNSITSTGWPNIYTSAQAAYYLYPTNHGKDRRTYTIDISSLQGNFYITAYEGTNYQGTLIYNFWLE